MPTTREELKSFQQFAESKLGDGESTMPLDELFMLWHDNHCRDEVNEAIRRGLADVESGRYQAADDAIETIRNEFGFTK